MNLLLRGRRRRRRRLSRQVNEDGAGERRDGVIDVEDAAERIGRDVADGVDERRGGRGVEGVDVRFDVAFRRKPRGRQEGGVGFPAGGVDEEVGGVGAAVGERKLRLARLLVRHGRRGQAPVVRDGHAEFGQVRGGVAADCGPKAMEQARVAGQESDGFRAPVLRGDFAGCLDAGGAAADDGDGSDVGDALEDVFEGGAGFEVGAVEGPQGRVGGCAGCENEGVVGDGDGLAGFGECDGDGFLVLGEIGGLALDEVEAV